MPAVVHDEQPNNLHKLFLQAMLLRRAAPKSKCLQVWRRCGSVLGVNEATMTEEAFTDFISTCNTALEPLGLQIAQAVDQGIGGILEYEQQEKSKRDGSGGAADKGGNTEPRAEGKKWFALVRRQTLKIGLESDLAEFEREQINIKSDELSKVATDFSATEIAYFRRVIDKIVLGNEDRFCISHHAAVRLGKSVEPQIKFDDCEKLLSALVRKGWLSRSEKKNYALSVRANIELGRYLTDTFGDDAFPSCNICHDPVYRGWRCANTETCRFVGHSVCLKRSLQIQGPTCPTCKQPWEQGTPIGEDAPVRARGDDEDDGDESEPVSGRRRSGATQKDKGKAKAETSSRKRTRSGGRKTAGSDESEDEGDDETEEEGEGSSPVVKASSARRTSGRSKANRNKVADYEEEEEEDDGDEAMDRWQATLTQLQAEEAAEMEE